MSAQTELLPSPRNACVFSACEQYRYALIHSWGVVDDCFVQVEPRPDEKRIMWIGLNPSTADQNQLDPTLRRIRWFSHQFGFRSFVMTNLFAYRATKPRAMLRHANPIGTDNDAMLTEAAKSAGMIIACWGTHGAHLARDVSVRKLINAPLFCLGINEGGTPRHPLYVPGIQKPIPFAP